MLVDSVLELRELSGHPAGNPPAGVVWQYALGATIYQKNNAGVVTDLGAVGGGINLSHVYGFQTIFGT